MKEANIYSMALDESLVLWDHCVDRESGNAILAVLIPNKCQETFRELMGRHLLSD